MEPIATCPRPTPPSTSPMDHSTCSGDRRPLLQAPPPAQLPTLKSPVCPPITHPCALLNPSQSPGQTLPLRSSLCDLMQGTGLWNPIENCPRQKHLRSRGLERAQSPGCKESAGELGAWPRGSHSHPRLPPEVGGQKGALPTMLSACTALPHSRQGIPPPAPV